MLKGLGLRALGLGFRVLSLGLRGRKHEVTKPQTTLKDLRHPKLPKPSARAVIIELYSRSLIEPFKDPFKGTPFGNLSLGNLGLY